MKNRYQSRFAVAVAIVFIIGTLVGTYFFFEGVPLRFEAPRFLHDSGKSIRGAAKERREKEFERFEKMPCKPARGMYCI